MMKTELVLYPVHRRVIRFRSTMFATAMACLLLSGVACEKTEPEPKKTSAVKTEKKQAALPAPAPEVEVVYASEIPLFENGNSSWQVVIPAAASTVNKFSADEFVNAVKKISGVEIPIVYADELQPGNNIVIGSLMESELVRKTAPFLNLTEGNEVDDTIAIHTVAGNLYLAGNNPRSATYAVYHFLREYLGVRWFWPGDDGEFMPKRAKFMLPEIAYNYQSPFRYRALTPGGNHGNPMIELGLFRMFMNAGQQNLKVKAQTGTVRRVGGHTIGINSTEFKKHPDWFAMIDGKRRESGVAGCWSNEGFTQAMVDRLVNSIKKADAELLCAFPFDVVLRCQCPECTKIKNKSARWYTYYAKLIKEVRKQCPDIRAAATAYQEFRDIPDSPVEDMEYVEYCLYNRCYIHPLDDESCKANKKTMDHIREWQKLAPMGAYGYEYNAFEPVMYIPLQNQFALTAKVFRDMKFVRLKTEYPARLQRKGKGRESAEYLMNRLSTYVYALTAWDPDLDVNKLVKDFCQYVYGAGGDAMYEYHTTMGKYWDTMNSHLGYFLAPPDNTVRHLLNFDRIRAMKSLIRMAEKAVAAMPDEAERNRAAAEVELEKRLFDAWETTYYLAQDEFFTLNLPKCSADFDFDKMDKQQVFSKGGTHKPTDVRMFWSEDGIHLRVVCKEAGMDTLSMGKTGRDVPISGAGVEIFVDANNWDPVCRLGVNPAGGIYDARGNDISWNPEWKVTVKHNRKKDQWTAEFFLPFASFGYDMAPVGKQWRMSVVRNGAGGAESCAFPELPDEEYRNLSIINFSATAQPGKTVVIYSRDPKKPSTFYSRNRNQLVKNGWQAQNVRGSEQLLQADLNDVGLIVFETYANDVTPEVFHKTILPAVKNGTVIYFWAYYHVEKLPLFFKDPTFKIIYKDDVASISRYSWITNTSFATTPSKFRNGTTPPGVLTLEHPESWEVLAKQRTRKLEEKPCVICRPYGKGMVALSGGLYHNTIPLMNNIIEYNKVVNRDVTVKE